MHRQFQLCPWGFVATRSRQQDPGEGTSSSDVAIGVTDHAGSTHRFSAEQMVQIHEFVVKYLGVHIRNYYNEDQSKQLILTLLSFINVPGIRKIAAEKLQ